jgi:hypothetical protein
MRSAGLFVLGNSNRELNLRQLHTAVEPAERVDRTENLLLGVERRTLARPGALQVGARNNEPTLRQPDVPHPR